MKNREITCENTGARKLQMSNLGMRTNLGKGFAPAQVSTVHSTSAEDNFTNCRYYRKLLQIIVEHNVELLP